MPLFASFLNSSHACCCQEPVSSFSHLVGAVWFAFLAKTLLQKANGGLGQRISLGLYAFSCVLLLSISGIYHWLPPGFGREIMRRMDVAAIFLLIAGTFTPICATMYRGTARWGSLGMIWAVAVMGILFRTVYFDMIPEPLGIGVFLGFGWLGGILAVELWHRRTYAFVKPLILGGLAYTAGTLILEFGHSRLLPPGIGPHDLWHFAVLLGIDFHWRFVTQIVEIPHEASSVPDEQHSPEFARLFASVYDPAK